MTVEIHMHRRLPRTEVYACSKKEVKASFTEIEGLLVDFGSETHFEFDTGVHHPPQLNGTVVATATVERDGTSQLALYPLRKVDYAEHEHQAFIEEEFDKVRAWFEEQRAIPETQVVSNRQLILELVVDGFVLHQVEFA